MHDGVDGLLRDKSRPPGKAPVPPKRVAQIVRLAQETPPDEATHWTARAMAKAVGCAVSTVQSIWKAHGLAPHRWRIFKLSNDPAETPPSPLSPPQASTRFEHRSSFGSGLRSGMPFFSSFSISCTALVVGTDAATQALLTDIGLAPLPAKQKSMSRSPGGGGLQGRSCRRNSGRANRLRQRGEEAGWAALAHEFVDEDQLAPLAVGF